MARPRIDIGPDAQARIAALLARGLSREDIARELGVSKATAGRRMSELRAGTCSKCGSPLQAVNEVTRNPTV